MFFNAASDWKAENESIPKHFLHFRNEMKQTSIEIEFHIQIILELSEVVILTHLEIQNPIHNNHFAVISSPIYSTVYYKLDNSEEPRTIIDEEMK